MLPLLLLLLAADPDAERFREGKEAFSLGVSKLEAGEFTEAAAAFERSVAARESAPALYNLALAYQGMGRWAKAIRVLARQMAIEKNPEALALSQRLMEDLVRAAAKVTLEVRGDPEVVLLDGEPLAERGELFVDPGSHRFEARREGHRLDVRTIAPVAGSTLALVLDTSEPLRSQLLVETAREDAEIRIDGDVVGRGNHRADVVPGPHRISVAVPGIETTWNQSVDVAPGSLARVYVELDDPNDSILTEWWLWTAIGVVVAGAVTTAVVLTLPEPAPQSGDLGFAIPIPGQ